MMAHSAAASAAAYSGSKAYVLNFTQSLQMEYTGSPIRIQIIMPGSIRSEFFSSQGLSESIFPPESYLAPEQLVDAALAGRDSSESVTIPSRI
jgi:short-subunit dehydrogenase